MVRQSSGRDVPVIALFDAEAFIREAQDITPGDRHFASFRLVVERCVVDGQGIRARHGPYAKAGGDVALVGKAATEITGDTAGFGSTQRR